MFHSPNDRFRQHLWLCIAFAITATGTAARLGMAEKPGPITPVVIEDFQVELPSGEEPVLVATDLDPPDRRSPDSLPNTQSVSQKSQSAATITPVVIDETSKPATDAILDVPPQIISVPLETLFQSPADSGQVAAETSSASAQRSDRQRPRIEPNQNEETQQAEFEPVAISDWPRQTPPALMDVPARIVSVPQETIAQRQPASESGTPAEIEPPPVIVAPLTQPPKSKPTTTEPITPDEGAAATDAAAESTETNVNGSTANNEQRAKTEQATAEPTPLEAGSDDIDTFDIDALNDRSATSTPDSQANRPTPPTIMPSRDAMRFDWWQSLVTESILEKPTWVAFDMETVLLDTLRSSPRIQIVSRETSIAIENIVQQDAAFDSTILFDTGLGRVNDPVGNTLTTGGPPRLIDDTVDARAGIRRTTRRGATIDIGQELGLKTSNSQFFDPTRQGDTRLALSLTQPLLDRAGQVYNERLVTQARIDSRVSWQEMRVEVEQRIAEVMTAYWQLYELRCHLLQHIDLLRRAQRIESLLVGRQDFDVGQIELAKARQRVARRRDRVVQLQGEVLKQQTRLVGLVGAEALADSGGTLELIPNEAPQVIPIDVDLRSAVQQGIENRPEVRAATQQLESAALTIRVTRAELVPQLNAVVDAYLAGLNGDYDVLQSFGDQFSRGGPGIAAALEYQMPRGRRAAKSRVRQAQHRFRQRSEELREVIQATQVQIDTAVTNVQVSLQQQQTKQMMLETAITEEAILTRRWEMMAGDGSNVGTVLENLLDAQQRRTDAEREWASAQTQYLTALVNLQRSMGTLLIRTGIAPRQLGATSEIQFDHVSDGLFPPVNAPPGPPTQGLIDEQN